jgi:hypothetical protein
MFDHMEAESFRQDNTETFHFYAWMAKPDLLPRNRTITFFPGWAGRSSASDGPTPTDASTAIPPDGGEVVLLFHLDHYWDWTPQPEGSLSSEASGLLSSGSSSGLAYSLFRSFTWAPGVLDSRPAIRPAGMHLRDACRRPPSRDRCEEDPDADGQGPARLRLNINARGSPIDDLPRADDHGAQHRTRSLCGEGGRGCQTNVADISPDGWGRYLSRSLGRSRTHQPPHPGLPACHHSPYPAAGLGGVGNACWGSRAKAAGGVASWAASVKDHRSNPSSDPSSR